MSRRRPLTAQRVFFAARRVRGERRAAFVERVCRENAQLRAQVAELLARAEPSTDFLRPATQIRGVIEGLGGPSRWETELSGRRTRRGPPLEAGVRIAERYAIEASIGEGSSGRVYRARDEVLKTAVAVKVLDLEAGEEIERLRREAATLRWLRVPGVVNLQDDGVDEGRPYIVTDLVEGAPFPGAAPDGATGPRRWEDIRETAVGLLETLARIHAQGVIHGDLKPANVLVDAKGIATVLDVGIASGPSIDFGESEALFAGTPSYMAPERIGGAPASVATDLYAVGVMLHQALIGVVPHHAASRTELLDRRRLESAPAIAESAPDVPKDAARMIDALLAREAKDRPASAYDALDLLEHRRYVRPGDPDYPWLGSRELIDKLVQSAKEGRSMDIWGPPGSGKTRTLKEAAKELEALGRKVVWLAPSTEPFGSLASWIPPSPTEHCATIADLTSWVGARVRAAVASGIVVCADDFDELDTRSASVLDGQRREWCGTVWRAHPRPTVDATRVPDLCAEDLRSLFAGHDIVLHVPSDAAAELRRRTHGNAAQSLRELDAWCRAGIAELVGGRIRIQRSAITRLSHQPRAAGGVAVAIGCPPADDFVREIVDCLADLDGDVDSSLVARIFRTTTARVESALDGLIDHGLVELKSGGRIRSRAPLGRTRGAGDERHRALRWRIAEELPSADPARIRHVLGGGRFDAIPDVAARVAEAAIERGDAATAIAVTQLGLSTALADTKSATLDRLAIAGVAGALRIGSRSELHRFAAQLALSRAEFPTRTPAEIILRAALQAIGEQPGRAISLIERVLPTLDSRLAAAAHRVRVLAARSVSSEAESEAVRDASMWASRCGEPTALALVEGWRGWLAYGNREFAKAAALHRRAAECCTTDRAGHAAHSLDAAQALLDAGLFDAAVECARGALQCAEEVRLPVLEALAMAIRDAGLDRSRRPRTPGADFRSAVLELGVPHLSGTVWLGDAALLWRMGESSEAHAIADRAAAEFTRAHSGDARALALGLAALTGTSPEPESDPQPLLRTIRAPAIAVQCWAMFASAGHVSVSLALSEARVHADGFEPLERAIPREVLSIDESFALLARAAGGPGTPRGIRSNPKSST